MSVNLHFAQLHAACGPGMRMRNRIFRAYVHRAILGIYFTHSCTIYVGFAQARRNYYYYGENLKYPILQLIA